MHACAVHAQPASHLGVVTLAVEVLRSDFREQGLLGKHPLHDDFKGFRQRGGEALENHCRFEAWCKCAPAKRR